MKEEDSMVGHTGVNFAGDQEESNSTSGYVFMLAGEICWRSRKQTLNAQ